MDKSGSDLLTKRVAISKANAQMVGVVAFAAFITVFCLFAAHAVWSLNSYQARVTTAKQKAHQQLLKNIQAYGSLSSSYNSFVSTPNNVIGGLTSGSGDNDGSNAKIILDALPATYDFPALTASIEKILTDRGFNVSDITGTDDQVAQQTNGSSPNPQAVTIPFTFTVTNTNYAAVGQLMTALQQSIRPIQVDTIDLSGGASDMSLTISAHTYYQPSKSVSITEETIK
jgi:hypothetical protein